ncbi:transposase [Streptococcus merionis]|uniref:transposase n=1 Tax=Streptococcus merionis TaxID=400065 RepID=UPI003515EB98
MSKSNPKSTEEKLEIIRLYLTHEYSISQLVRLYQVSESTIKRWTNRYEKNGMTGLKASQTWKKYSKEVKEQAVQDYLDEVGSQSDICQIRFFLTICSPKVDKMKQPDSLGIQGSGCLVSFII